MERYTQVGKDAIHRIDPVVTQEILDVGKIAVCKCKPAVLQTVLPGIHILVHSDEAALLAKTLKNGTTVAAATKGGVNISAIRLDCKPVDALVEQRRYVIHKWLHDVNFCRWVFF